MPADDNARRGPRFWPAVDVPAASIALALAAAVYALGVRPIAIRQLEELRVAQTVAREGLRAESMREGVAELDRKIKALRTEVESTPFMLLPASAVNARLADLTALAERHGLALDAMTPQAAERHDRFTVVPVRFSGRGSYAACAAFLAGVHAQFRDVAVRAVRMTGNPEEPGATGSFEFECAWYAALDVAPGSASAQTP
jgi:Tfp pilus assembly protein PilO